MDDRPATRRRFLAAAGATAASLAGCLAGAPRSATVEDPHEGSIPEDLATEAEASFRGGLGNRGYFPDRSVPDDGGVEWTLPELNTGDHTAAKASAVPAPDGTLVWPGDTGTVHAVAPDGTVEWRAETDTAPGERGIHGTPTIANGTVYVGAYDGALYAFDLADGSREWKAQLGDAIGSSPKYHDGTVYVAVEYIPANGSVVAVDAGTGDPVWSGTWPRDHPHSTLAIDVEAGKLVVGSNDGHLYAWEYPSLERAWRFATRGVRQSETYVDIKGPVTTYAGAAYFGSWDHRVYRVDLETGTEDWSYRTGDAVMSGPAVDAERDVLLVGSQDHYLHAVDVETGRREWTTDLQGWVIGCPSVTSDAILVGSYVGLWALDRETGEFRWGVDTDGWVTATPRVSGGRVYVAERAPDGSDGPPGPGYAIGRGE